MSVTGVLRHTQDSAELHLQVVPDSWESIDLVVSTRRAHQRPRAPHALVLCSSPETRLESMRTLVGEGLERGGTVVVLLRVDDSSHMIERLDSAGLHASAAVAEGRLNIGTAQQLGVDWPDRGGRVSGQSKRALDAQVTSVIVELGSESPTALDSSPDAPTHGCACDTRLSGDVTRTCLATPDEVPASTLLAALDHHPTVILDGRPIGSWIGTGSSARALTRPRSLQLELYTSTLSIVGDPVRLAELEAAMLARVTGARGAAVSIAGVDVGPVGEENGRPLSPTRRRQLAQQLASPNATSDIQVLSIPTRTPGTAALMLEEGRSLSRHERSKAETLLAIAACCHDKLADAERADRLASENSELRTQVRTDLREALLIQTLSVSIVAGDVDGALRSLSEHLECQVALVGPNGSLMAGGADIARSFALPPRSQQVDAQAASSRPAPRDGGLSIMPVLDHRRVPAGYLCLETHADDVSSDTWEAVAHLLAAALEALGRRARDASEASLLLALVRGDDTTRFEHRRWASRLHIDLARTYRVIMLSPGVDEAVDEARLDAWAQGVRTFAKERDGQLYVAKTPEGLVCLRPDEGRSPEDWAEFCRELSQALHPGAPGFASVGSPGVYPTGLARSYDQARRLGTLQRQNAAPLAVPVVAVFEQTGLIADMLGPTDGRHLAPFVRRVLGPLLDDTRCGGELVETLGAYLASGGSPAQTAERLHLHRSSVKYRVKVLRDVIGDRLDDPDRRFELELAIRLLDAFRSLGTDLRARAVG